MGAEEVQTMMQELAHAPWAEWAVHEDHSPSQLKAAGNLHEEDVESMMGMQEAHDAISLSVTSCRNCSPLQGKSLVHKVAACQTSFELHLIMAE